MTIPEIISLPHRHQATSLPRTSQQARQTIENTQTKQLTAVTTTTVLKLHGPEKDLQNSRVCCSSIFSFWGNSKHFTNSIHIPGPLAAGIPMLQCGFGWRTMMQQLNIKPCSAPSAEWGLEVPGTQQHLQSMGTTHLSTTVWAVKLTGKDT